MIIKVYSNKYSIIVATIRSYSNRVGGGGFFKRERDGTFICFKKICMSTKDGPLPFGELVPGLEEIIHEKRTIEPRLLANDWFCGMWGKARPYARNQSLPVGQKIKKQGPADQ